LCDDMLEEIFVYLDIESLKAAVEVSEKWVIMEFNQFNSVNCLENFS
jgi:hypothetical protein